LEEVRFDERSITFALTFETGTLRNAIMGDLEPSNNVAGSLWRFRRLITPGLEVSVGRRQITLHT
jgi:hypothetical protein